MTPETRATAGPRSSGMVRTSFPVPSSTVIRRRSSTASRLSPCHESAVSIPNSPGPPPQPPNRCVTTFLARLYTTISQASKSAIASKESLAAVGPTAPNESGPSSCPMTRVRRRTLDDGASSERASQPVVRHMAADTTRSPGHAHVTRRMRRGDHTDDNIANLSIGIGFA